MGRGGAGSVAHDALSAAAGAAPAPACTKVDDDVVRFWCKDPSPPHAEVELRVVAASEVPTEVLVDTYVAIQGPSRNMITYGIQGDVLRAYARFLCSEGQKFPWSTAVVDPAGRAVGYFLLVPSAALPGGAELPAAAREHWGIFLRLRDEVRRYSAGGCVFPACDADHALLGTFLGFLPAWQGRGLASRCDARAHDVATEMGYTRWWTWTVNPKVTKAVSSSADTRVRLMSRASDVLFRWPCWAQNGVLMPVAYVSGMVPRDWVMFTAPVAWFPQLAAQGVPNIVVGNQPLRSTSLRRAEKAERERRRRRRGAPAMLLGLIAALAGACSLCLAAALHPGG